MSRIEPRNDPQFQAMMERFAKLRAVFGEEQHAAVPIFDDAPCYPLDQIVELANLEIAITSEQDEAKQKARIAEFSSKRKSIQKRPDAPERMLLWPEHCVPTLTEYTDNSDLRYSHDPDFQPYMLPVLLPEDVAPKGAVLVIPGGSQGRCTVNESYQTCRDFNALGYQAFVLHSRPNNNPWNMEEVGADVARAVRIVRSKAAEYRIHPDNIAIAGTSNGGLATECCVLYHTGKRTMKDYFPGYTPDALDEVSGAPNAVLCVYGPHFAGTPIDLTDVNYPPTFFAVGRNDTAMDNLHYIYPILVEHGVPVEVHTFAGTPHGYAGMHLCDGVSKHPNWELWVPLADAFMQDAYANK